MTISIRDAIQAFNDRPSALAGQAVVTVRMSRDFHAKLRDVADENNISTNRLCVLALETAVKELSAGPVDNKGAN